MISKLMPRLQPKNIMHNEIIVKTDSSVKLASQLHEAILANSFPVVQLLLDHGVDPNISPQLASSTIVTNTNSERFRNLLLTLHRMFRIEGHGCIHPLEVAVCNAYHHSLSGGDSAVQIIKALLEAGADINKTCHGIVFCQIGNNKYLKFRKSKTAIQLALFMKRFPLPDEKEVYCSIMDEVTALLLLVATKDDEEGKNTGTKFQSTTSNQEKTVLHMLWRGILEDNNSSYTDLVFVCPDGTVKAHKCVLAVSVPYFRSAIDDNNNNDSESSSPCTWKTSNSLLIMKTILQFIYTGDLNHNNEEWINDLGHLKELLHVASNYQLDSLVEACGKILSSPCHLNSPESCKSTLFLARNFNMEDLYNSCIEFIRENTLSVLMHPTFLTLSRESVELWEELSETLSSSTNGRPNKKRKTIQ